MTDSVNSGYNSDVLRVEDVDNESQPVDTMEKVRPVRNVSEDTTIQRKGDISDMPNVVQCVEDDTETETIASLTERSGVQSLGTNENVPTKSPSKKSENWTTSSEANLSENKIAVESTSSVNQMYMSYSTLNEQETKSVSSRKIISLERLKSGIPKLTVETDSVKTKETLTLNEISTDNNVAKDQSRCDSSMSRVPTRMSQRSIDAKIPYTTLNMPAEEKREVVSPEDSWIRLAIPYLPLWLAVICLLLNMIIPGMGTAISGFCIFCCATSRVPAKYDQEPILLLCVNIWVGVAQLFTVTFMLVGWFWSLAWGIRMVLLSLERRRELREQRAREIQKLAVKAFSNKLGW